MKVLQETNLSPNSTISDCHINKIRNVHTHRPDHTHPKYPDPILLSCHLDGN